MLHRLPRPSREAVALAAILAAATAVFWATRLDLLAADRFRVGCCSWPLAERPFWSLVYRYGIFVGVLLAAAALVAFTLSYWFPRRLLAWRRPALFLVLVAALGPGLLVNVVFKDHYGRPRPREVQELGGQERFLPVWVKGSDPQAKSFPCGHCSMGFYVGVPWLVLRRRRRAAAAAFLGAGLLFGFVLGASRMMAGGHFLSDVVWAGGMVWIVALVLHRVLAVDAAPAAWTPPADLAGERRKARMVTVGSAVFLAGLTVAVLLATPYFSSKSFARTAAEVRGSASGVWEVDLDEATVSVAAGPGFEASYQVQAFGFPNSRLNFAFAERPDAAVLSIDKLGWFTERRQTVALRLPAGGEKPLRIRLGKGRLALDLRGFAPAARLDVEVGEGEVRVLDGGAVARAGVSVRVERGQVVRDAAEGRP
jgi:membrane-associated PAP2 superfamily phosphatase